MTPVPDSTPFSGNSGHSVNTNNANPERPGTDQRWSIWPDIIPTWRGPRPHPDWLVTDAASDAASDVGSDIGSDIGGTVSATGSALHCGSTYNPSPLSFRSNAPLPVRRIEELGVEPADRRSGPATVPAVRDVLDDGLDRPPQ